MMIERKILEALDACRPESDDLQAADHPELAEAAALVRDDLSVQEAFSRVQHFDAQIRREMESVDLPSGLAERVKARLAAVSALPSMPVAPEVASEAESVANEPVSLPVQAETTRRRWLWSAMGAVAASVAVVVWQFQPEEQSPLSREKLRSLSRDAHVLAQDSAKWETDLSLAPTDRAFPDDALLAKVRGFQFITLPGDKTAIAYDVTFRNQRSTVIVYRATAPHLDLVPPQSPFNTEGVCVGLWQRNGLLFALVVEGSPASYRQLLHSNQGNLG